MIKCNIVDKIKENPIRLFYNFLAVLTILAGIILVMVPVIFWDFLVTYQFRPTVRPLYPLFYGSIITAGMLIMVIGLLGLYPKFTLKPRKIIWARYIVPVISIIMGSILLIALINLYSTTEYLAADKLFGMILSGLILGIILFILLLSSGISEIFDYLRKIESHKIVRLANKVSAIIIVLGLVVAGIILGPTDAPCVPFPEDLPFKTTLFSQGDANYHTFKIPTMITAPNGTILAFAEARVHNQEDWGKMDVVVRRSYDLGTTWTPLEVIIEDGDLTIGNACPVVDRITGYIWLIFCKENDTVYKMYSEDNGESWSTPVEITKDVKEDKWTWYATGPSHGIQLEDGTLVIPADHIEGRKMKAHIIYSKDNGNTWKLGGTVPTGEEATLVELDNGDLYINIRPVKPGYRVTAISKDKGLTWINTAYDKSLPDPACQGNMIKMDNPSSESSIYLFVNAADKLHREKMTVRVSYDECKTWTDSKTLYSGMASYSAISLIDPENNIIGCIFERGCNYYAEEIVFTRFPLDYITG